MEGVVKRNTKNTLYEKTKTEKKISINNLKDSLKRKETEREIKEIKSDDLIIIELPKIRNGYGNYKYLMPFQYLPTDSGIIDEGNVDGYARSQLIPAKDGCLVNFLEDESGKIFISVNKTKLSDYQKKIIKEVEDLKKSKKEA